ncbi:MAG: bifunctional metallophosphatase/5'-nucleotidase [Chloroflexi bacterium]|nr:bifunctional metallophosphatase/5'-nucleotidase [Chloroflexota bacterium]
MTRLTILHTNDIHGRLEQLARISTLAKRIRREVEESGGYCALWDAGDVEDPTLFESQVTKGSAALALLRAAGFDLAALGNASPIRYGQQVVPNLAARFGRPLLCANMIDPDTSQLVPGLEPYTIQPFGEINVGIIGLTAPMSIYSIFKLRMGDPVAMLPELIAQVRARGAQTIVLLSHLGFDVGAVPDKQVAEHVAGLDLIIGGHSHTQLDAPVMVKATLIAQAGEYGRFLGRVDLDIDPRSGKIIQHHGELISVGEDIPLDGDVLAALAAEHAAVAQILARVIGELCAPIDWAADRQCAAGNLFADALLDHVQGAEIALTLAGHWRGGLGAGALTVGALTEALRSSANPARVKLTGAQIVEFLRAALKPENAARKPRPLRGVAVGMPHVAAMTVRYAAGTLEIVEARVGGEPLEPQREYIVAATDLEFSDLIGYFSVPEDQIEYEAPIIMPEIVEAFVAAHSPLSAPAGGRVEAVR